MADNTTPTPKPGEMIDPAKHNAEIAAKVAQQDISGKSTVTGEFGEATDALDKLAAQVKPKEAPPVEPAKPAKPDVTTAAPVPDPEAVKKAAEEAKRSAEELKRADEFFKDSPKLPPNASPKSSEAFSSIKLKAAQEISAREQEIEKLKKQIEDAKKPSPEILEKEKELEDLRLWRAKVDVEYDPKFKGHDKGIEQQREFIYAQLSKNTAFTPEIIEQIKKYGGPDMVNMSKLFELAKDPTLQRLVESKLADIEMAKYNKDQAIKAAKENISQYIKEREEAQTKAVTAHAQAVTAHLSQYLDKLEWYSERQLPKDADEATKKEIESHNEFIKTLKPQVMEAISDNTPEMKAVLVTGMAQLFKLQREVPALKTELEATKKSLAEITAKWEAVKNSSRSRLNESAAPSGGITPPKADVDVNTRASDALDTLAKQVMEKRAQAAAGQ